MQSVYKHFIDEIVVSGSVSKKMYALLKAPDGIGKSNHKLHPSLIKQYDVSEMFPDQLQLKNVLLSPNGVVRHMTRCASPENCRCIPKMYFCDQNHSSCLSRLKRGKLPKFSIANGNWVGELPPDLRKMSYGSLSLMRPVQSYGRIANFSGTSGPGGSCLKGHVYSNRLDTAFVTKTVPIIPGRSPVRVLVVSPFREVKYDSSS